MNTQLLENNQTAIFARAIDLHAGDLTPEAARFILALELTGEDEQRMNELAEKSRAGQLSASDEFDLEEFRRCGRLIEMLKLKARKVLQSK